MASMAAAGRLRALLLMCIPVAAGGVEDIRQSGPQAAREESGPSDPGRKSPSLDLIDPVRDSTASAPVDVVTEELFRQYVVGRGKIPTSIVQAAIEIVAVRGRTPEFAEKVLSEFENTYEDRNSIVIRRNLLRLMAKMLGHEGDERWWYEYARQTGDIEPSATTSTLQTSRDNDTIMYGESEMLRRVIARGREANRHEIDQFVIAVRQSHHPQGKQFLLDVLRNASANNGSSSQTKGNWADNLGGTWQDAKFHAAVGLAELGEHAGVEWLIKQSELNDFGVGSMSVSLSHAPHAKANSSILRESCLCALQDLSGLESIDDVARLQAWWASTKNEFQPKPIALRMD